MTDRIVQMKDKSGNKCFPIAANPGAPKASDTVLGMVKAGTNLEADADGVLRVNGTDSFTSSDKEVYSASKVNLVDRFHKPLLADSNICTQVPANTDLNSTVYFKIGTYYQGLHASGQTIANNPCNTAFTMYVYNVTGGGYDDESTNQWCYRIRELTSINGDVYIQKLSTEGTANVWTIGSWKKQINKSDLFNMVYPVGSIYMSVNNTSPQTFFGGTWEQIQDTFLLAAGSTYAAGSTGGEATHKLVANELPKIQGTLPHVSHGEHKLTGVFSLNYGGNSNYEGAYSSTSNNARYLMKFGNDQAHNNMPPYLTVYMWKRTA